MKPENKHSTKIWNLFTTKIGSGMATWNLTQWLPFSEDTVGFILNKPNFFGAVSITDTGKGDFIVSFQGFNWAMHAVTILNEEEMVSFIDKLGNEPKKAEGHRAPVDVSIARSAAFSAN